MLKLMPKYIFLITQKALIQYHALNYDESEREFEKILVNSPHNLDDMDSYSNILYVKEKLIEL